MSFIMTYLSPPAVILINLSESREEPFLNIIHEDPLHLLVLLLWNRLILF